MHVRHRWVLVVALLAMGTACSKVPAKEPNLTIKDIMKSRIDPAGDFLFESVQDIADDHGVTHKGPRTDAEWAAEKQAFQVLVDQPELLIMDGRKAAQPSERSRNPE